MNRFENAKIYKIVDNSSDMVYIGSACKTLQQRLKKHESDYKNFKAGKYCFFLINFNFVIFIILFLILIN